MKKYFVVLFMLFITISFAQAPDTVWTKTYGEYEFSDCGNAVIQTSDGGYFVTGWWYSGNIVLLKTDTLGDTLWVRNGGPGAGYAVDQTFDGGYFIGGATQHGDFYVFRVDSLGNMIGNCQAPGSPCNSLEETSDSGCIAVGTGNGPQSQDVLLIKTLWDGSGIWTSYLGDLWEDDFGGAIQQTADGGFIIAGMTYGFGATNSDVLLIKTDASGDSLWNKIYGSLSSDAGYSVDQTTDGGYVITGYNGWGGRDVYLIKTDSAGNLMWEQTYGGSEDDEGCSVQQTADGGYIVVGYTRSFGPGTPLNRNIYIIRTDPNGDTLWTQTYGTTSDDCGSAIQVTSDGGYIVTGQLSVDYGGGHYSPDIVLMRMANDAAAVREINAVELGTYCGATIFHGPLLIPEHKNYKVFDIAGRVVLPQHIKPGIYFIEIDGKITRKVIKVR